MSELVVIGGGPAGIAAAQEGARRGARVTVIERDNLGGRANWHSLLPSKVWLSAADRLTWRHEDVGYGLTTCPEVIDYHALSARVAMLSKRLAARTRQQLDDLGVRVIQGAASFEDAARIRVTREQGSDLIAADAVIVATGSAPFFLPTIKPDGQRIFAPRLMGKFTTMPDSMIVIGAGATGAEFVYLFSRLGLQVTWITDLPDILPGSDADIRGHLEEVLTARGVQVAKSSPVTALENTGESVAATLAGGGVRRADMAFIATGRTPDLDGLNLDAAGLAANPAGVAVDEYGRTAVPHIYAAGDATGAPMVANKGIAQGYVAARHALGAPTAPYRPETVVEAVYTFPQIAQIGLTETRAAEQGRAVRVIRRAFADNLKAHLEGESAGFVKLLVDPATETVLGGAAVGAHAADVVAPLALALAQGAVLDDLRGAFAGYPTLSELVFDAARAG